MATEEAKTARMMRVRKIGVVDSISGTQTIRIVLEHLVKHSLYGKYLKHRRKMLVHDEQSVAKVGDTVEVAQCRPISKNKSWRLIRVVRALSEQ
jgi:small subunit ribosomal protein S17